MPIILSTKNHLRINNTFAFLKKNTLNQGDSVRYGVAKTQVQDLKLGKPLILIGV